MCVCECVCAGRMGGGGVMNDGLRWVTVGCSYSTIQPMALRLPNVNDQSG